MTYRIIKGLEAPCKIKGLLSTDYWMMIGWLSSMFILLFLGIRSALTGGNWNLFNLITIISLTITPVLYRKFRKRSESKKFDEIKSEFTISNLELFKKLR